MPEITVDQAIAIATQHHEAGRLAEAEGLYRQILALNPENDDALRLLGIIMMQNGQPKRAVDLISRAIAINPAAQYHINLGNALKAAGDIDAGIEAYRKALRLKADYPQAYYNLGVALADKGLYAEAVEAYRQALGCKPGYSQPLVNLGVALAELGQADEAIATYHEALRVNPKDSDAYANLGNALRGKDRPEEAIAAYEQAIAFKPASAEAHWNLATLLLVRGDFQRGQQEFEWRWKWKDFPTPPRKFAQRLWDGAELHGRTILLYHEQGLGDTIQFVRYAPLVAGRGGRVVVQCPPELSRLLRGVGGITQVVTGDPLPPFDVQCPMMSLPLAFATRVETIPANHPYLAVDPALVERWRARTSAARGRLKVGLVWAGSSSNKKDALRSITFSQMAALGRVPDVAFFSLQKGKAAAECAMIPPGMELIDLTDDFHDFADTAALVSHLDLVIAVDTAVAHLAGAMGKPVWVLIPSGPDWRWLLDREDSPWYPTMRLFRQKKVGDWAEVIERVGSLGIALLKRGQVDEAVAAEKQSLRLQPDNAQALHILGSALKRKGDLVEAAEACRAAIRIKNDYADAHCMLGNILAAMGRYDEALASYQQALAHDPRHYSACLNIGYCLAKMGRYVEAQAATRRAIEIEPDLADLHYNLGNTCKDLGDLKPAVAAYERAIELDPKCADAHWNLAVVLLLQGDFQRGWVEHEWRWQVQDSPSHRRLFQQPQWNGQDLAGKTILLHTEQGFGDAIQFIRYAPLVARRGGCVVLHCTPEVSRLFATVAGIEQLVTTEPLPPFDVHCPLMSLPLAFSSCVQTIPAQVPYLKVDPALAERWGKKLNAQATGLKVGLAWSGRRTNKNNAARSLSVSLLAPLQKVSGVTFYSLQKEKVPVGNPPGFPVIDCSADLHDFAETAAMISHLDLVISVDTAVVHLAGALGKPVWVLIPFIPDWRWMMDRQDSPWYPTMRLFRQKRDGDWVDVIARVEQALRSTRHA